ncbi:hypothetical protein [Haloarcula laminariae]|uniref:hypothetical protein n=1 Tax=Haloarcula laminariae TaxID=2961577 RepID=UPI0021C98113|nr:hypothetical protein [Halomicroarcula laminariae]
MLPKRYRLENFNKAIRNPRVVLGELSKLAIALNTHYYRHRHADGIDVLERDWDNLVILDGCRADTFREVSTPEGKLQTVRSGGSESWEFMRHNFLGRALHDTVYVTANPYATKLPAGTFHAVENLIESDWDPDLRTVPPRPVTQAAIDAAAAYPDKRLIVHYMQPHYPFIGPAGQRIEHGGFGPDRDDETDSGGHVWTQLQYGLLEEAPVRAAYRENLEIVLKDVTTLLNTLDGKSVITSDHGNLLGERIGPIPVKAYGHPPGLYVDELLRVPWLVRDGGRRRTIRSDPPKERTEIGAEVVSDRLEALGYKP